MSPVSRTPQSVGWVACSLDGHRNSPARPLHHLASISSFYQVQSGEGIETCLWRDGAARQNGRSDERRGGGMAAGSLGFALLKTSRHDLAGPTPPAVKSSPARR